MSSTWCLLYIDASDLWHVAYIYSVSAMVSRSQQHADLVPSSHCKLIRCLCPEPGACEEGFISCVSMI